MTASPSLDREAGGRRRLDLESRSIWVGLQFRKRKDRRSTNRGAGRHGRMDPAFSAVMILGGVFSRFPLLGPTGEIDQQDLAGDQGVNDSASRRS